MAIVQTVRPGSITVIFGSWSTTPSGTLLSVLTDDTDTTYATAATSAYFRGLCSHSGPPGGRAGTASAHG